MHSLPTQSFFLPFSLYAASEIAFLGERAIGRRFDAGIYIVFSPLLGFRILNR